MSSSPDDNPDRTVSKSCPSNARIVSILGVVAIGVALFGFLIGIGEHKSFDLPQGNTPEPFSAGIQEAPSYRQMSAISAGPNSGWESPFSALKQDPPGLFEKVTRTHEMKMDALADRRRSRAFEGAPPVIPHPITQQTSASCLVCHETGLLLGNKIATRMSHTRFTSCTQCHIESAPSGPFELEQIVDNQFSGIARSGPGTRAMAGAPPTIPHTTWLRENCLSCHGLVARPGLRTTHPFLSNCVQCHVTSAEFNLVPFGPEPAEFSRSVSGERHPIVVSHEEQTP